MSATPLVLFLRVGATRAPGSSLGLRVIPVQIVVRLAVQRVLLIVVAPGPAPATIVLLLVPVGSVPALAPLARGVGIGLLAVVIRLLEEVEVVMPARRRQDLVTLPPGATLVAIVPAVPSVFLPLWLIVEEPSPLVILVALRLALLLASTSFRSLLLVVLIAASVAETLFEALEGVSLGERQGAIRAVPGQLCGDLLAFVLRIQRVGLFVAMGALGLAREGLGGPWVRLLIAIAAVISPVSLAVVTPIGRVVGRPASVSPLLLLSPLLLISSQVRVIWLIVATGSSRVSVIGASVPVTAAAMVVVVQVPLCIPIVPVASTAPRLPGVVRLTANARS